MTVTDKYIFVHIPKTAGLSIRKLFEAAFGADNVSQPFVVSEMDERDVQRLEQYRMISGHISDVDARRFRNRRERPTGQPPATRPSDGQGPHGASRRHGTRSPRTAHRPSPAARPETRPAQEPCTAPV